MMPPRFDCASTEISDDCSSVVEEDSDSDSDSVHIQQMIYYRNEI